MSPVWSLQFFRTLMKVFTRHESALSTSVLSDVMAACLQMSTPSSASFSFLSFHLRESLEMWWLLVLICLLRRFGFYFKWSRAVFWFWYIQKGDFLSCYTIFCGCTVKCNCCYEVSEAWKLNWFNGYRLWT